ncbi:MAG: phosphoribosylanthranilate isomerase [Gemmatimonadota bacterium]
MLPDIKFCGLTRGADARAAAALGARYLGVVFAPSLRQLTLAQAASVFESLERPAPGDAATVDVGLPYSRPQRVGVFAELAVPRIVTMSNTLRLDVIQLHDAGDASRVQALRDATDARLWTVLHVGDDGIVEEQLAAAMLGDAVLVEAKVDGQLGGTGRTFDWAAVRDQLALLRAQRPVILAGGLRPDNVARAIGIFAPDVVDVSSGVEQSPGIKDPARMRAFADAVHGVDQA